MMWVTAHEVLSWIFMYNDFMVDTPVISFGSDYLIPRLPNLD